VLAVPDLLNDFHVIFHFQMCAPEPSVWKAMLGHVGSPVIWKGLIPKSRDGMCVVG
jgi:hypothetical protein